MSATTTFIPTHADWQSFEAADYALNSAQGARAVAEGLTTGEWYRTSVPRKRMKELMQRSDGPAIRDTLLWLGLLVASGLGGALLWGSWLAWPCFFVYGVLYGSASDSRWHETGHGTAFRTQWMNTVVYQIACFMIMRNPTAWKWSHTRHHTDTIIVGRDPEIVAMRPPALWKIALNFLGILDVPGSLKATVRQSVGKLNENELSYVPESEHQKVVRVARVWLIIYTLTIIACVATRSIIPLMLIGLPRMYGAWHHLLTGLTQHCGLADNVLDHRLNTRSIKLNPISRFVYWNMNYHVEHHMFPMVPFHQLPALSKEIAGDLPAPAAGLVSAYKEFLPVLLRQRKSPETYIKRSTATAQNLDTRTV
jgi:fatty acid desaturase